MMAGSKLKQGWCASILALFLCHHAYSQNILSDIDHDLRHRYDRMIITSNGGPAELHPSLYPYWRSDLVALASEAMQHDISMEDEFNVRNIFEQNNEFLLINDTTKAYYHLSDRPFLKTFYKTPAFFYEVDAGDFYLRINPLFRFALGRESNEEVTTFVNQRGVSVRGGIAHNVYFHTSLYDSQIRFPNYINEFTDQFGVVPGAGLFKNYDSALFDFSQGRDFLIADAYVGVDLGKYIGFQLGHQRHFIGDGIRSLLLSDFSTPFFSLKLNTRIWKLHYQNIFAELAAGSFNDVPGPNQPVPKKYMAAHYLSFKPWRNVSFGLFEAVVFNRPGHRFELQYLNPVILYRTVEGSIGSPDNVLLGINGRWDMRRSISLYGQFMLDDLLIREILNGNSDWWGNKYGHQLGLKYINAAGIENLDLQFEWNRVRPYTYSHYDANANYSNYKQALAHPLGANFNEWIGALYYQITPRLNVISQLFLINKGEDEDSISYGGNILIPNVQRPGDYGNILGQGIAADIFLWSNTITYEISSGLMVDLQYVFRDKDSDQDLKDFRTNHIQLGIRLNMARRDELF